jgi:hypothetical protein
MAAVIERACSAGFKRLSKHAIAFGDFTTPGRSSPRRSVHSTIASMSGLQTTKAANATEKLSFAPKLSFSGDSVVLKNRA